MGVFSDGNYFYSFDPIVLDAREALENENPSPNQTERVVVFPSQNGTFAGGHSPSSQSKAVVAFSPQNGTFGGVYSPSNQSKEVVVFSPQNGTFGGVCSPSNQSEGFYQIFLGNNYIGRLITAYGVSVLSLAAIIYTAYKIYSHLTKRDEGNVIYNNHNISQGLKVKI